MSRAHAQKITDILGEFRFIRDELAGSVRALGSSTDPASVKRRTKIVSALGTLGDKYSLAMVAVTEASMREALGLQDEKMSFASLIDRRYPQLSLPAGTLNAHRLKLHELRKSRNAYAHQTSRMAFPTPETVAETLRTFLHALP